MPSSAQQQNFMKRCFDLAKLGARTTSPNPMVGAVLVYDNRIIGEGFHQQYGSDHAEVNCINSVHVVDRPLIKDATLYISLEPCCIVGNTPACTDLIQKLGIKNVIYSSIDPTPGVNGNSKQLLEKTGTQVTEGIDYKKGDQIVRYRSVIARLSRPYIILKFARSADGFMGINDKQVWLSNSYTKTLSHKWRSEVDAIMVGTNTAKLDNPKLNNRLYFGKSPLRIVLDRKSRLSKDLHVMDKSNATWVISENDNTSSNEHNLEFIKMNFDEKLIPNILENLYKSNKGILLVEGGSQLLQSFVDLGLWDEARIFNTDVHLNEGVKAPRISGPIHKKWKLRNNEVYQIFNPLHVV